MDRVELKLSRTRRSLWNFVALIVVMLVLVVVFQMSMPPLKSEAEAQQTSADRTIDITIDVAGAEPDVKGYQIYMSTVDDWDIATGSKGSFQPIGGVLAYNPNDPAAVPPTFDQTVQALANSTTRYYFTATAIDTSNNEGPPVTPAVWVDIDLQSPGSPAGITVSIRVVPVN